VAIAYHANGYPFYCADGGTRWTYYGIGGTPYVQVDGSYQQVVGGIANPGSMYPTYRQSLTTRGAVSSPLTIALTSTYDTIANTGTVNATVTNTTSGAVSGTIQFAVIENAIPYSWGPGLTTVEHVCRDMLPDGNGEAVTIPASGNIVKSRNFTIDATWAEKNVMIVVFVQSSAKEVYQTEEIAIVPKPNMEYLGLTFTETSGNSNRIAQPGEGIRMYLKGKNWGTGFYTGPATISTSDAYITITGSTPQTISIGPGDMDTVLITNFNISPSCPSPHQVSFLLTFAPGDTNTVPFIVSNQTGFADNIESGQGSWVHSGTNDGWHITTHRSHSTSHSWYCGVENTWLYTANNDASLVTPYFVSTPDSNFKFWYYDSMEIGYDYGYVEIDNNSGHWIPLTSYNVGHLAFTQEIIPMSAYSGQTIRMRFHFFSDGSVNAEGWYVDDVQMPVVVIGADENQSGNMPRALSVTPNPFRNMAQIIIGQDLKAAGLRIFDISGRLVRNLSSDLPTSRNSVRWNGTDESGKSVPAGLYFVQLDLNGEKLTEKILRLK
jgi:hypothetical protein